MARFSVGITYALIFGGSWAILTTISAPNLTQLALWSAVIPLIVSVSLQFLWHLFVSSLINSNKFLQDRRKSTDSVQIGPSVLLKIALVGIGDSGKTSFYSGVTRNDFVRETKCVQSDIVNVPNDIILSERVACQFFDLSGLTYEETIEHATECDILIALLDPHPKKSADALGIDLASIKARFDLHRQFWISFVNSMDRKQKRYDLVIIAQSKSDLLVNSELKSNVRGRINSLIVKTRMENLGRIKRWSLDNHNEYTKVFKKIFTADFISNFELNQLGKK